MEKVQPLPKPVYYNALQQLNELMKAYSNLKAAKECSEVVEQAILDCCSSITETLQLNKVHGFFPDGFSGTWYASRFKPLKYHLDTIKSSTPEPEFVDVSAEFFALVLAQAEKKGMELEDKNNESPGSSETSYHCLGLEVAKSCELVHAIPSFSLSRDFVFAVFPDMKELCNVI